MTVLDEKNMEGFVRITPRVQFSVDCLSCKKPVVAQDWKLPGMWMLGKFHCEACGSEFFQDLPYSLGVMTPCNLDIKTSTATPVFTAKWYADLTINAWRNRCENPVRVTVERSNHGKRACLVNCLYPWWGDAVGLLLRVNQLKQCGMDVIVLINPGLRWLIPDDVGGVWIVEQELDANVNWNEALDAAIKAHAEKCELELYVPITFQPAYITRRELQDACKIQPFPREEWNQRLKGKPTVTFMWREDRCWARSAAHGKWGRLVQKLRPSNQLRSQADAVVFFAGKLKERFPNIEFAVCGQGRSTVLPGWIKDMRLDTIGEGSGKPWAEQAARSHLLCGVTGSHLTIPGALAGAYVELVPDTFWPNILTCAPVTTREPRETLFCHRLLPVSTSGSDLADMVSSMLLNFSYAAVAFKDAYYNPLSMESLQAVRSALGERRQVLDGIEDIDRLSN